MNDRYNNNMFLKPSDLNNIEDKIEDLTNEIQEKVFNNQQSSLRNIEIGDDLGGKTIYLSFPRDIYENIDNNTARHEIVTIDENTRIAYLYSNDKHYIYVVYKNKVYDLYAKKDDVFNPYLNYVRFKLPYDFGIVSEIDDNDEIYQYVKIYDNELIIPNYIKHIYNTNDIPTMQQIDNLENGINNIGNYYYKPFGFINHQWFKTSNIDDITDYCIGTKNISYQDLNRWVDNLNLINFENIDNMTIWNGYITQLKWNKNSSIEWEEL